MRRWFAMVVFVAACSGRYGTYLVVDGKPAGLDFDRVELYFGLPLADGGFATPAHPGSNAGTVFGRAYAATDVVPDHGNRAATYYLPPGDATADLGAYVVGVAYQGTTPVGIGERFGFRITADREVLEYMMVLEPYVPSGVERWGANPGCIAWKHHRDADPASVQSVVAVVRGADRDCDEVIASADCDDLAYCAPGDPACNTIAVCGDGVTCAIGCAAANNTCKSQVCAMAELCDPMCDLLGNDLAARYYCAFGIPSNHTEVYVPTLDGVPCETHFQVPAFGYPCANARLEYTDSRITDGFTFLVGDNGTDCLVDVVAPPTPPPFAGDHHIVISFDPPAPGPRWSFVLGLYATATSPPCQPYSVTQQGVLAACQ